APPPSQTYPLSLHDALPIFDVERIDAHEPHALRQQHVARIASDKRVGAEVLLRAPMAREVGPDQHGPTGQIEGGESVGSDRAASIGGVDDDAAQVRE